MANEFKVGVSLDIIKFAKDLSTMPNMVSKILSTLEKQFEDFNKQIEQNTGNKDFLTKKAEHIKEQIDFINKSGNFSNIQKKLDEVDKTLDNLSKKGVNAVSVATATALDKKIKTLEKERESITADIKSEALYLKDLKATRDEISKNVLSESEKSSQITNLARLKSVTGPLAATVQKNIAPAEQKLADSEKAEKELQEYNELIKETEENLKRLKAQNDDVLRELAPARRERASNPVTNEDASAYKQATTDKQIALKEAEDTQQSLRNLESVAEEVANKVEDAFYNSFESAFSSFYENANKISDVLSMEGGAKDLLEVDNLIKQMNADLDTLRGAPTEVFSADGIKEAEAVLADVVGKAEEAKRLVQEDLSTTPINGAALKEAQKELAQCNKELEDLAEKAQGTLNLNYSDETAKLQAMVGFEIQRNQLLEKRDALEQRVKALGGLTDSDREAQREAKIAQAAEDRARRIEISREKEARAEERLRMARENHERVTEQSYAKEERAEEKHAISMQIAEQRLANMQSGGANKAGQTARNRFETIAGYAGQIGGAVVNTFGQVFSWVGKTAVSAVRTLFNGFTSLGSSVLDFGMKAASVFGGWLIDGISKVKDLTIGLGKAFLKVSEHLLGISLIKNVWGAVTGLFQRIMRLASLAFVFRVLTQWFRQLKNDVVDAFKTYLNYDSALNTSVNNLKNSFSTLKSQLASAFAPIVEIIVPYLTTFVNWCVTAANALSALIAALTGKTSWKKAVVNSTGAVSKGADNAADSLDNAADKAEELKEKLGAYDKLNVIQDDNDKKKSGSGNKGGGTGGSGNGGNGISYVDQEIGDKIKGLADWLKDMWNKADLTELGRKLGEMLRDALKKIPWDKIQDEAKKTAKRICTLIAGFVTTPGLAQELGKAIGELINTGIIFANTMVHDFPWKQTGQFLADGLNAAINTIDFHMAGDTIATGLNGIMDLLNTFLDPKTGLDFSQLGKKIADFINTATTLDWERLGLLATNLGTDIATFVNELSAAEVLTHIGTLIGNFIEAAVTAFKTFVDNTDFKSLGSDVGGFVKAIGDSISEGLKKLSEIDVAGKLNEFIEGFKAKVKPEDLKTWGSSLGAALGNAISGLAAAIYDNREYVYEAASSFVSGLVSGAGAAITEEDFGHVGATLSYWLSNAINDIGLWLQDENNQKEIKSDLKSFFNNLASNWNKGTLGNLGAGIKRGLGTIGSTVSEYIDEHGQDIKDEVIGFFEHLLGNGDGTLDSADFATLGDKIHNLFESIKTKITEWINDPNGGQAVVHNFSTLFDHLVGNGDGSLTFSDVWNFISEIFGWLNDSARQLFKSEDFLGSLAGFLFLVKSGLLGKFLDIGGGVAKKFLGGIVEGLGKKAVVDKISGAVSETELTTLGTSWGTLLGNSFGAAAALVIGILITDALAGMAGEAWNDSINEKGKKGLTAGQTKIYDLATISGLREGNNIKDKESVTALHDFLETLGTKDFNVSGLSTLVDNTNLSLDQFVSRLKLIQDQEDLTAQEQEDLNSIIEAAQGIIDYTRNKVTDFDGDLESLESTSKGVTFTDLNTALEDLYNSGQISEAEFKLLQGNLKELEKDNDGPAAFQRIIDKIVELKGEDAARYFAGDIKNSILAVRDALSQVDVSKLKDSLDKLNGSWDEEVVNAYLGRISEFQDSGDIDLMAASFGELLGYLKDNGASAKDLAGILENTLGIKIDGTRSSVEKAKEALSALGIPDDVKTSLFNTLDSLVTKEDKVTEKSPKVKPEVDDTEANKKTDDFSNKVAAFGQLSAKAKLEVDTTGEEAGVAKAEGDLNTYKDGDYTASIKADASDLDGMLQAGKLQIDEFNDKYGTVTVEIDGIKYDLDLADEETQAVLEKYRNGSQDPTIAIKADDSQAQEVISTDETDWALFEEDDIVKTVKVEDQASEPINNIKENSDSIQDEKSINFVDLNSSGALMAILLGSIFSLIVNSIPDEKTVKLSIENNTEEPIKTIKQSLSSIADHVKGEVKPNIETAFREAFSTIRSDAASYMTGGQSVISAMFNMVVDAKTKLNDLQSAFNSTFSAIVQTVSTYVSSISQSIRGIPNKEVDVKVDDGGSTQNVIDIIDKIPTEHYVTVYANWVGEYSKTFYATVEWSNVSYTALGGIFNNGFWSKIPQYAGGTANAHGSLFLAGEAGPEVVGHVNGRTEVLNKSQIAAAIYMAVRAAMGEYFLAAMSAVIQTIVNSANSINTNLGYLKDQYQLNNAYLNEISVAGLSDVGALKSYYNNVISTSSSTNLDSLADRVASRLSGNININNETYLDGSLIYNRMVEIDRQTLKMTGQSGFGGR